MLGAGGEVGLAAVAWYAIAIAGARGTHARAVVARLVERAGPPTAPAVLEVDTGVGAERTAARPIGWTAPIVDVPYRCIGIVGRHVDLTA